MVVYELGQKKKETLTRIEGLFIWTKAVTLGNKENKYSPGFSVAFILRSTSIISSTILDFIYFTGLNISCVHYLDACV